MLIFKEISLLQDVSEVLKYKAAEPVVFSKLIRTWNSSSLSMDGLTGLGIHEVLLDIIKFCHFCLCNFHPRPTRLLRVMATSPQVPSPSGVGGMDTLATIFTSEIGNVTQSCLQGLLRMIIWGLS